MLSSQVDLRRGREISLVDAYVIFTFWLEEVCSLSVVMQCLILSKQHLRQPRRGRRRLSMAQRLSIGASLKAPTCRSLARGRSCRLQQQQPSVLFSSEQRRQTNGPSQRRYAVTAASPTVKQSVAAGEISSQGFSTSPYGEDREVLEGLRSVQRLLNRIVGGPSVWDERLSHAQLDLQAGRSIRIGGKSSRAKRLLS